MHEILYRLNGRSWPLWCEVPFFESVEIREFLFDFIQSIDHGIDARKRKLKQHSNVRNETNFYNLLPVAQIIIIIISF